MNKILILFVWLIIFTSCSTTTIIPSTLNINDGVVLQMPVVVELDVSDEKVSGSYSAPSGTPLKLIQDNAINNALEKTSADVLIEPVFTIEKEHSEYQHNIIHVTVIGFPGVYKNFHTITEDEIQLINLGKLHQIN